MPTSKKPDTPDASPDVAGTPLSPAADTHGMPSNDPTQLPRAVIGGTPAMPDPSVTYDPDTPPDPSPTSADNFRPKG